jgi:hypothetical protein
MDEEDVLAVVAALGDVVRHPRNNDSGGPWHDPTLTAPARRVNAQGTPKAPAGVSAAPAEQWVAVPYFDFFPLVLSWDGTGKAYLSYSRFQ